MVFQLNPPTNNFFDMVMTLEIPNWRDAASARVQWRSEAPNGDTPATSGHPTQSNDPYDGAVVWVGGGPFSAFQRADGRA